MRTKEYNKWMHNDNGSSLVPPEIPATTNFELKGHILAMIKDIPFYRKDHEDGYKHIYEVNDIDNYFNILNIRRATVLLRMLPVTFRGATKGWLKALPPDAITTWAQLCEEFIQQFSPPSMVAKLKKNIANFEQKMGESLYEAWERYKCLRRNCLKHDLNDQQMCLFSMMGVNVTTRQLLDS